MFNSSNAFATQPTVHVSHASALINNLLDSFASLACEFIVYKREMQAFYSKIAVFYNFFN